jgi:hypothetical protein
MSIQPEAPHTETPPGEDMKTTLLWTGGAIVVVAIIAVFMI